MILALKTIILAPPNNGVLLLIVMYSLPTGSSSSSSSSSTLPSSLHTGSLAARCPASSKLQHQMHFYNVYRYHSTFCIGMLCRSPETEQRSSTSLSGVEDHKHRGHSRGRNPPFPPTLFQGMTRSSSAASDVCHTAGAVIAG